MTVEVSNRDVIRLRQQSYETEEGEAGLRWALTQIPAIQSALISLDPRTGAVRAMVGGYDFAINEKGTFADLFQGDEGEVGGDQVRIEGDLIRGEVAGIDRQIVDELGCFFFRFQFWIGELSGLTTNPDYPYQHEQSVGAYVA